METKQIQIEEARQECNLHIRFLIDSVRRGHRTCPAIENDIKDLNEAIDSLMELVKGYLSDSP